jgi:hypothetical protein
MSFSQGSCFKGACYRASNAETKKPPQYSLYMSYHSFFKHFWALAGHRSV